ncbi:hypothetical protein O181_000161 [Austropuccinia psidii MF-1]|uniref:Uncharacterized protein n=1 Tax=Austropuccinia psidii MF-1 TaxID=1389203 RepID=A0A9Q3B8D9_9BASI|nr:hypothetical protein [Austropuccinia psidii MF-1]
MSSTQSGESYNPSSSSQEGYRSDYGRIQSVSENEAQTDKLCHSKYDKTVLTSNRADTSTRSLSGYIQSQPEGIQKSTSTQIVQILADLLRN